MAEWGADSLRVLILATRYNYLNDLGNWGTYHKPWIHIPQYAVLEFGCGFYFCSFIINPIFNDFLLRFEPFILSLENTFVCGFV